MNQSPEKVLAYLTGSGNIDDVTVEDLQKLVAENPYFPVTQFLLAKKVKGENKSQYSSQLQKTSLYFSNPYWLQYQLSEENFVEELFEEEPAAIKIEDKKEDISSDTVPAFIEQTCTLNSPVSANETASAGNATQQTVEQGAETDSIETDNTVENTIPEAITQQAEAEQEDLPNVVQVEEEIAAITRGTNEETQTFISDLDVDTVTAEPFTTSTIAEDAPLAAETEVVELEEEMAGVTHSADNTTERFLEEAEHQSGNDGEAVQDEHDRMFQNIKAMLDATSEEADADTKDSVIPIDPYYTIDYFASQGIKLELDKNPQDQLGQNLKKFTQWLRHMKKLGPEDATEVINRTESEADIQQIADSSNTVREVVTEAMASVLEKQGKKEKAIELYNKLSFLYPNKNAYFADKIKKLKGI